MTVNGMPAPATACDVATCVDAGLPEPAQPATRRTATGKKTLRALATDIAGPPVERVVWKGMRGSLRRRQSLGALSSDAGKNIAPR